MISRRNRSLALCLVTTLGGCAASGEAPIGRRLPDTPSYARSILVKEPDPGEDAVAVAGRERAGRKENGRRLDDFATWYRNLQKEYGGNKQ